MAHQEGWEGVWEGKIKRNVWIWGGQGSEGGVICVWGQGRKIARAGMKECGLRGRKDRCAQHLQFRCI